MTGLALIAVPVLAFGLRAHWGFVALFVLLAAPAVWEVLSDARSTLGVTRDRISWKTGARGNTIALADIDQVRLATRLDFSQRARLILNNGSKVTIPGACLPPGRELDNVLQGQGITVSRSLF
jgi:hypothetical protein